MINRARLQIHLELVGRRFVAAMAVLLAVAGNAAFAQEHKTYRCKVADVVSWGEDGRLRPDSNPKEWARQQYDGVIIDTLTGAVNYPDGRRELWIVLKRGDDQGNDYVLAHVRQDVPLEEAMFVALRQFIHIRTWGGTGVPPFPKGATPRFLAVELDSFASGPCEVVR